MDSYSKDSKHYALGGKNKIERNDLHKKKMLQEFDSLLDYRFEISGFWALPPHLHNFQMSSVISTNGTATFYKQNETVH